MEFRPDRLETAVTRIDDLLGNLLPQTGGASQAIVRWRGDAAALRFHLRRPDRSERPLLAVLGGTGTGKSTVVNRLLNANVSAASYRRTFTAGPVAATNDPSAIPEGWLGVEHVRVDSADLPARGRPDTLLIVEADSPLTRRLAIVDTPDLDGDQPVHHAEADRVFRWADALLLAVTPEKYQMTELLPYYRLVDRYGLAALFVINKCERQAVADDYARLLASFHPGWEERLFLIPRDDAAFEPPPGRNLDALRTALADWKPADPARLAAGRRNRGLDLLGRLDDQILAPLRQARAAIDAATASLRAVETPAPGVNVNPLTRQLQRRMQQRSVLYLMGPGRVMDRIRQTPGLLVRLPRVAWDYIMRGEISAGALNPSSPEESRQAPDFQVLLKDHFAVVRSRLDDLLRNSAGLGVAEGAEAPWQGALLDPSEAGRIADEELAELKSWLERRWNATPRDTRMLESLLKHLPGGRAITRWTEAAPYLLVLVVVTATHHLFGGVDLAVLGGWSVATWLTERLSNEVAARTRLTNQKITDRFTRLAHDQIERLCRRLNELAPSVKSLDLLARLADEARQAAGE